MQTNSKIFIITLLICFVTNLSAQDIPEEARRHLIRGRTAIEMARSPEDYDLAIIEFNLAIQLAPLLAEPYYELGIIQEKVGKYVEAIASLKKYIELAPGTANIGEVQDLIYKIEFKAEQTLSMQDIREVIISFAGWQQNGNCTNIDIYSNIKWGGEDLVKIPTKIMYYYNHPIIYNLARVVGTSFKFSTGINNCDEDPCWFTIESEIEIVSRTHVKVKQTYRCSLYYTSDGWKQGSERIEYYSSDFIKK